MKNFEEKEVKNLESITGGKPPYVMTRHIVGFADGTYKVFYEKDYGTIKPGNENQ